MPFGVPQFIPHVRGDLLAERRDARASPARWTSRRTPGGGVAVAIEVEVALKLSSDMGGVRVDLPLEDRSLGLNYDWFR